VAVFLTWFNSAPTSIADAAQREALRRQLLPKATHSLTNPDVPAYRLTEPETPLAETPKSDKDTKADATKPGDKAEKADKGDTHDEAWWRTRLSTARDAVDHDQMALNALQSQINGLTADFINRDDPGQKAQIEQQRNRALAEQDRMKKQMD